MACIALIVAAKPTFGIWLVILFAGGMHRFAIRCLAIAALLLIAPLAIYGPSIFVQWIHAAASDQHYISHRYISLSDWEAIRHATLGYGRFTAASHSMRLHGDNKASGVQEPSPHRDHLLLPLRTPRMVALLAGVVSVVS